MYETLKSMANPVGLIGVVLQLIVYFFLSMNRLSSNTLRYQLCNMLGACCILYSLFFHWNTPSVIVELAWLLISLRAVVRLIR
jgi:cell division protein FtsW (lipid II flippase)